MRALVLAATSLLLVGAASTARAGAPPAKPAAPKAAAQPLVKRSVAGGWFLEPAADPARTQLGTPSLDATGARFLVPLVEWDEAQAVVQKSVALVVTAGGRVERTFDLRRLLPLEWQLSADGKAAAVLAQDAADPESNRATLLVFDVTKKGGAPLRQSVVDVDSRLAGGKSGFALAGLPVWLPEEDLQAIDESDVGGGSQERLADLSQTGTLRKAGPITFVRASGDRVAARTRLQGEVVPLETADGFVTFGGGKLVRADAKLAKVWEVDVGFEGPVAASHDGSLIVVADHSPGKAARRVVAFDAKGKKRGEVTFPAPLAVELAVAPDGAGFLVTAAALSSPTISTYDGLETLNLACYAPDGTLRWSHTKKRDADSRVFTQLSLSKGAAYAAAAWLADAQESVPALFVFGKDGKVVYSTEGPFETAMLDPSGDALWTLEGSMLSRLTLKSLIAGTATKSK